MSLRTTAARLAIMLPLAGLIVAGSAFLGPRWIGWNELCSDSAATHVFWQFRVPRVLLAACAGAGLAIGGVIFQTLFRNPLAEPYTLGVASGASLGAALGFLTGWPAAVPLGLPPLTGLAFCGALAAMSLVYVMSRLRAGADMTRLLLAGICVAYMCSAGILLITFLADRAVTNDIVVWMMGSLAVFRPRAALEIAVVLLPVLAWTASRHRALDLLMFGEHLAASRGVALGPTIWSCYGLAGTLTAVIVANCGPIGFIGLMVPHIGRLLFGVRTLPLLLGSAITGAAFLAVCDGIARSLPVTELPVGVVTSIIGAAFFLYMLATRDSTPADRSA